MHAQTYADVHGTPDGHNGPTLQRRMIPQKQLFQLRVYHSAEKLSRITPQEELAPQVGSGGLSSQNSVLTDHVAHLTPNDKPACNHA